MLKSVDASTFRVYCYKTIFMHLSLKRSECEVAPEVEAPYLEALDEAWQGMSAQERSRVESWFGRPSQHMDGVVAEVIDGVLVRAPHRRVSLY